MTVAQDALKQSGGDARAAFYSLARAKGVNPEAFLKNLSSSGMMQNAMTSNPAVSKLAGFASMLSGLH